MSNYFNSKAKDEEALSAGDTVYLRVFGDGPFVLIQPTDNIVLKGYQPDPRSKHQDSWHVKTHIIDNGWVTRDKKGNYRDFPAASLTTTRPTTASDVLIAKIATLSVIAGCAITVTSPFWAMGLLIGYF